MKKRVKQLATENVRMLPDSIWMQVKQEMKEKYGGCWTGKACEYVQGLVLRTRRMAGMGDKLKVLEDDPTLKNLPERHFSNFAVIPIPTNQKRCVDT
jgi:hypothetical protein